MKRTKHMLAFLLAVSMTFMPIPAPVSAADTPAASAAEEALQGVTRLTTPQVYLFLGEDLEILVERIVDGKVIPAEDVEVIGADPYITWTFDKKTGILTFHGVKAGAAEDLSIREIHAKDPSRNSFYVLTHDSTENHWIIPTTTEPETEPTAFHPHATTITTAATDPVEPTATTIVTSTELPTTQYTEMTFDEHPTLVAQSNNSTVEVGDAFEIYAVVTENPNPVSTLKYEIEDASLAGMTVDHKYSNTYNCIALKPGTFRMTFYFQDQKQTVEVKIQENPKKTTATTTTTAVTTTTATTTTETATADGISYDASPMEVGEVRMIRLAKPAGAGFKVEHLSDNFKSHSEFNSDEVYITALGEGDLKFSIGSLDAAITIPVKASTGKAVQKLGQLDEDEAVNAGDATEILKEAARIGTNKPQFEGTRRNAADVDFNGVISADDALVVLKYAALKGAKPNMPDFAKYLGMLNAQPERRLSYTTKTDPAMYAATADWTPCKDPNNASRYHIFTSAEEFETFRASIGGIHFGSRAFDNSDMIAIVTDEASIDYQYELATLSNEPSLGAWTVQVIRKTPVNRDPAQYKGILYIPVPKGIEFANTLSVEMLNASYNKENSLETNCYLRLGYDAPSDSEPQFITSKEELAAACGDFDQPLWTWNGPNRYERTSLNDTNITGDTYYSVYNTLYLRAQAPSGFYDLHVTSIELDKETGELTVNAMKVPAPTDIMGGSWHILVPNLRPGQVKSVKFRYTDQVLQSAQAIRQNDGSMDEYMKLCNSPADVKPGITRADGSAYDDAYFRDHSLILVGLELGSGSIRPEITNVTAQDNDCTVTVTQYTPEVGTDDMAYWILAAETSKISADADHIRTIRTTQKTQ